MNYVMETRLSEPEISCMSEKTRYRHHGWHPPLEVLAYVAALIILLGVLGYNAAGNW